MPQKYRASLECPFHKALLAHHQFVGDAEVVEKREVVTSLRVARLGFTKISAFRSVRYQSQEEKFSRRSWNFSGTKIAKKSNKKETYFL